MWDQQDHPSATFDADAALFSLYDPELLYQRELPTLGFFRFLPLIDDGKYISGLTMHFLSQCIVGVESHFSTASHLVGSQGEVALHFPLAPDERIENVWLRLQEGIPGQSAPSVLVCIFPFHFHQIMLISSRYVRHLAGNTLLVHISAPTAIILIVGSF